MVNTVVYATIDTHPYYFSSPNPSHGCSAYTSVSTTEELVPVYYLVSGDEGECSYGRKAELAKKAFGSGVIIIDSP